MSTDENIARIIAINLKRLAYEHGKTQADISRDLNISKQTLSTWMNGQRIPRMSKVDLRCASNLRLLLYRLRSGCWYLLSNKKSPPRERNAHPERLAERRTI